MQEKLENNSNGVFFRNNFSMKILIFVRCVCIHNVFSNYFQFLKKILLDWNFFASLNKVLLGFMEFFCLDIDTFESFFKCDFSIQANTENEYINIDLKEQFLKIIITPSIFMDYVRDGKIQGQCTFKKTEKRPCISPSLT